MPPQQHGDTNVGFTLTPSLQQQAARTLDSLVEGLLQGSAVLIDRAGRIVEIARKPLGVQLPAISALAAGCFATTNELAKAMGDSEFSLLFQHENDQQVFIWPVIDRALLVVIMQGSAGIEALEGRLNGELGGRLVSVIRQAQEPPRNVPPPRVSPPEIPSEVRHRTRALTALIMDLQAKRPEAFTRDISAGLLQSREKLVQALAKRDWRRAWEICEGTRQWLLMQMGLSQAQDVGQVLVRLYSDLCKDLHSRIMSATSPDRIQMLYGSFYRMLSKRWPGIYAREKFLSLEGVDVPGLWESGRSQVKDSMELSPEFVSAMDVLIRDLFRVIMLASGREGRDLAIADATATLKRYDLELLPYGLEGSVGKDWAKLN